jgi:hypothetical protein
MRFKVWTFLIACIALGSILFLLYLREARQIE